MGDQHTPWIYLDIGEVVSEANIEVTIAVLPVENDEIGNLIAAAPDLLQELKGIVHFADGFVVYRDSGPLGDALREWINGARAAIAKATSPALPEPTEGKLK